MATAFDHMNSSTSSQVRISEFGRLEIFLVAMVIFVSNDTISFGTNVDLGYQSFKYLIYSFATFILLVKVNTRIFTPGLGGLLAIMVSVLLTAAVNFDSSGGYIYQLWMVLIGFLIVQNLRLEDFSRVFLRIILTLGFLSLLIFAAANFAPSIFDVFPVGENSAGVEFHNLYIGSIYKEVAEVRNASIFREPGVFMIYIMCSIIFEVFFTGERRWKVLVLLIVVLITTYSTAGFLLLPVLFVAYMLRGGAKILGAKNVGIFAAFSGIAAVLSVQPEIYDALFSKLSSDSASFGSSLARIASIVVNAQIFAENPFFGAGLAGYGALFERYSSIHFGLPLQASGQSTNTFMALFATYGVLYGGVVVYALIRLTGRLSDRNFPKGLLFLVFAMMFSSQDLRYSLLFYILVFYGLQSTAVVGVSDNGGSAAQIRTSS